MRKKVSLIVINYNGKHLLKDYFDSLKFQKNKVDEVILADNCSTDGSCEFVKNKYPFVKIAVNDKNEGTAGGGNKGAECAIGDYLFFQNNDIKLHKNCLKNLISTLNKHKKAGIVTSISADYKINQKIENAGGILDIFGFNWPLFNSQKIAQIPKITHPFLTYGNSFIIRKNVFEKAGGFDDKMFTLNDDVDLSWRVRLLNYNILCSSNSIVFHKGHATLGPLFKRSYKRYLGERNTLRTLLKNYSAISLIKFLPLYFSLLICEMGIYILKRRWDLFMAIIKSIMWNLLYFPNTLALRSKIQKQRKVGDEKICKMLNKKSFKLMFAKEFVKSL